MWNFLKARGGDLATVVVVLTAFTATPVSAGMFSTLPGPAAGGLIAGAAVIGALVVAKWRSRK